MTEKSVAGRNNELVNVDQSSGPTSRDNGIVSQAHLPCTCQLILLSLMIENESSLLIQHPTLVTSMHQRVERESNLENCILSALIRPAYTNFLQSPVFTGCISYQLKALSVQLRARSRYTAADHHSASNIFDWFWSVFMQINWCLNLSAAILFKYCSEDWIENMFHNLTWITCSLKTKTIGWQVM